MRRRVALVLLLLVLPLGAAACGGGKKSSSTTTASSSPMDAVSAAAQKTAKAGSMRLTIRAATVGSGTSVSVAGAGAFDTAKHEGTLHLHFATSGIASTISAVLDGTDLYIRSPLFSLLLPSGKTWIKLDLTKGAKAGGVDLGSLLSQDPSQALDALQSLSNVTEVGTVQVGGVSMTQYKATIKKSSGSTKAGGVYDVWIGDDGYIHRVRTTVAGTSGSGSGAVAATSNLSAFGQPVTVTVPPAAQTVTSTTGSIPGLGG
jgi:hypothetical protein